MVLKSNIIKKIMIYASRERYSALCFEIKGGLELRKMHPEISDDYRAGMTQPQLVRRYKVKKTFHLESDEVARQFVWHALFGNRYEKMGPVYHPLISQQEQIMLEQEHERLALQKNRRKRGIKEWSLRETLHAYLLSQPRKKSLKEIAKLLNKKYHRGRNVRGRMSITCRIYRFRNSLNEISIDELLENI